MKVLLNLMPFSAIILTLFPDMFPGPLAHSLAGKGLEQGLWKLQAIDIRSFAADKHHTVDDKPYGGGTGMVLKPDIVGTAIDHARTLLPNAELLITSPRGEPICQPMVKEAAQKSLIIVCGRFEGIDQRIIDHYGAREISLGDFVLSGGELAAMALLDACIRLVPGVIVKESALAEESFSFSAENGCLLEYPHYTRPPCWRGLEVPDVLTSGNHEQIRQWRLAQAEQVTRGRRPDLWEEYKTTDRTKG